MGLPGAWLRVWGVREFGRTLPVGAVHLVDASIECRKVVYPAPVARHISERFAFRVRSSAAVGARAVWFFWDDCTRFPRPKRRSAPWKSLKEDTALPVPYLRNLGKNCVLESVEQYVVAWFQHRYIPPEGVDVRMYSRGAVFRPQSSGGLVDPAWKFGEADAKIAFHSLQLGKTGSVVFSTDLDMLVLLAVSGSEDSVLVLGGGRTFLVRDVADRFREVYGSCASAVFAVGCGKTDLTAPLRKGVGPAGIHRAMSAEFRSSAAFVVDEDGTINNEAASRVIQRIHGVGQSRAGGKGGEEERGDGGRGGRVRVRNGVGSGVRRLIGYWTSVRGQGPAPAAEGG